MSFSDKSTHAILTGLAIEKEGLRTYLEFARKTDDITGKNMFILLAQDELLHMSILEKYLENGVAVEVSDAGMVAGILPKLSDIDNFTKGAEGVNQIHALELAMKFEERTMSTFEHLAGESDDEAAKRMFMTLAEMEAGHMELLEFQRDAITETGLWREIAGLGMEILD